MNSSRRSPFDYLRLGLIGILVGNLVWIAGCGHRHAEDTQVAPPGQTQAIAPLSADDVSLLFPAPTRTADVANLIAMQDLTAPDPQDPTKRDPVRSDAVFQQFITIANGSSSQVAGTQVGIGLPAEAKSMSAWFIAGIRIDAGAPGLSNDMIGQFGQSPQIRLIIQPVTRNGDGTPKVDDIAGHLIFDFLTGADAPPQADCLPRPKPDLEKLNAIVADLAALRTKLSNGQLGADKVSTAGLPLGVHPGLNNATTASNFRQEIKTFLERYISAQRLDAMAIAGLPAGQPEPWIFLSMQNVAGTVLAVHGPTLDGLQFAQMLERTGPGFEVLPAPHTNNLNPITCGNAAVSATSMPIPKRLGDATAAVFASPVPPPDKTKEILDVIADPTKSHFFNTDCVSCHTETQRTITVLRPVNITGIDPAALPKSSWNVRNFGWSPAGALQATVTRRTAAETGAVVTFINSQVLPKQAASKRCAFFGELCSSSKEQTMLAYRRSLSLVVPGGPDQEWPRK
jgi:hypothetical protein